MEWSMMAMLGVMGTAMLYLQWTGKRSPKTLKKIQRALEEGAQLVDVRSDFEFEAGAFQSAVHWDVEAILSETDLEQWSKERTLVLYCLTGSRSAQAARKLRRLGFDVLDLGRFSNGFRIGLKIKGKVKQGHYCNLSSQDDRPSSNHHRDLLL